MPASLESPEAIARRFDITPQTVRRHARLGYFVAERRGEKLLLIDPESAARYYTKPAAAPNDEDAWAIARDITATWPALSDDQKSQLRALLSA